jgi:subtilase family serine protease
VTYTVKNIGGGDAGASTTYTYADGSQVATDSVGGLEADKSYTNTVTVDPFGVHVA